MRNSNIDVIAKLIQYTIGFNNKLNLIMIYNYYLLHIIFSYLLSHINFYLLRSLGFLLNRPKKVDLITGSSDLSFLPNNLNKYSYPISYNII